MEIAICVLAVIFWALLIITFMRDRSRYRNCYFLFFAVLFTIAALSCVAEELESSFYLIEFLVLFLALLITPFFLICNGVLMFRREGHSLSNLLSFVLGLVVLVGELATFVAVLIPEMAGSNWTGTGYLYDISLVSMFISVSVIYLSVSFVIFMLYCIFLQIIPRRRDFDYVIIHGAGLLDGDRVSKLLSDRLDKAIEVYHKDPTPPIMIPSGGKGSDETISEAEAMARYLIDKGIPPEKIIKEDQSLTTFENLKFSKRIIDAREGSKYTVLVTSNYHVYRALRYCRKNKMKCTSVGSHVAFYYWPSALIREFIAVHSEKKHLITFIIGWVLCMIPLIVMSLAH